MVAFSERRLGMTDLGLVAHKTIADSIDLLSSNKTWDHRRASKRHFNAGRYHRVISTLRLCAQAKKKRGSEWTVQWRPVHGTFGALVGWPLVRRSIFW